MSGKTRVGSDKARAIMPATSPDKVFDPLLVKVKNGAAHVVGRVNGVLVYVEAQVSEKFAPAKVWMLEHSADAQKRVKLQLDPLMLRANGYVSPVAERIEKTYASSKARVIATASPFYAKVVDGVLYVQGTVDDTTVSVRAKASQTWSTAAMRTSSVYATVYDTLEVRTASTRAWSSSKGNMMLSAAQPYWTRAQDGCMYVQVAVGHTLVRIKVTAGDSSNRISAAVLSAYARAHGTVNSYTRPILAKIISVYEQATAQLLQVVGPYLEKARGMGKYTSALVNDVAVGIKVRAVSLRDRTQDYQSTCYIKFQDGFVYVQGVVGDKVVYVKVRLVDLMSSLQAQAGSLRAQAIELPSAARTRLSAVKANIHLAVTDRQNQVTAVSAVGGAATMGATGGATGLTAGAVIGAAVGVVPALFTFGLSIPIGAALGGATGLCAGTVAGGTVGFVSGGVAGRTVHKNKDEITNGVTGAVTKVNGCKDYMTEKTMDYGHSALNKAHGCKDYMTEKSMDYKDFVVSKTVNARARLVGGTGGSF